MADITSEELRKKMDAFLQAGGKVQKVPEGYTVQTGETTAQILSKSQEIAGLPGAGTSVGYVLEVLLPDPNVTAPVFVVTRRSWGASLRAQYSYAYKTKAYSDVTSRMEIVQGVIDQMLAARHGDYYNGPKPLILQMISDPELAGTPGSKTTKNSKTAKKSSPEKPALEPSK